MGFNEWLGRLRDPFGRVDVLEKKNAESWATGNGFCVKVGDEWKGYNY